MTDNFSFTSDEELSLENYALDCIAYLGKQFHKVASVEQLQHTLGLDSLVLTDPQLREAADALELHSKLDRLTAKTAATVHLPALIELDQRWWVLSDVHPDRLTVFDPTTGKHETHHLPGEYEYKILLVVDKSLTRQQVKFGLSWFYPSILRQKSQLRDIFLFAIVLQLFALAAPLLFENVIDKVLVGRSISSLHVIGMAMLALALAEPLYSFLRNTVFGHMASQINSELSGRLYRHLVGLPLPYFKQRQTGQIIARVREMAHIRQFLTGSTLMLLLDLIFIILFLGVMFHYSSLLTWIVISSLVLYFLLWITVGPIIRRKVEKEYESDADATSFLTEAVTGIETIKTTATEKRFLYQWQRVLSQQLIQRFTTQKSGLAAGQGIALIQKVIAALLLWWGVRSVLNGDLSPGELIAFNMLAGHVTQPILRLAQVWQDFQHTLIALRRVGDILDEPMEHSKQGLASAPELAGQIEFNNIRFRYHADTPEVLANLSLSIKAGEFIGITGPSGSGKSTLTRLLQRLYVPQHGQVLVDGMDLAIADPVALRRNMSVVLQESILFSGSIADNIRLCKPNASDEEVYRAAALAGATDFIDAFPHKFAHPVGEKGNNLSGGQRQRIALARALLNDPKILILDEATSALDYESEAAIMSNMDEICRNRTVISIAHRLNTLRYADKIFVLDQGKVVGADSHDALVQQGGLYAQLWEQQTK
ncbi:type I secretion system permease/ATPase [Xenorhabdus nematophila]|uniref:type I secretion system permease/ATPase n=1 Tax=Xenorhabdus nematophila TaxID=628 RepID=UPI000542DA9D|nr:type I secretion system permease/ATPase [Xenorhabdus nematophila]CEE91697.1 ABC transporter RTX toxin [Xenorhabdus nematophila str. Anatoliense]CEF32229.1 ABC transporter RTX toxin [Xenorhabdus nematophila str. Websteri]AYA39655.1 type I secretion system permease/ATPase [Xenorhabdus nematophila]MBA0018223.1 type I secretion system permease/ATPase [Xenorhabdus nematophila]MCB4424307.1 type I secretion system permease/ATPase [Xenorhabdus nematophila]